MLQRLSNGCLWSAVPPAKLLESIPLIFYSCRRDAGALIFSPDPLVGEADGSQAG